MSFYNNEKALEDTFGADFRENRELFYSALGEKVMITPRLPEKEEGGIIVDIPDAAVTFIPQGFVMSVGPKVEGIEPGDEVLFTKRAYEVFTYKTSSEEPLFCVALDAKDVVGIISRKKS